VSHTRAYALVGILKNNLFCVGVVGELGFDDDMKATKQEHNIRSMLTVDVDSFSISRHPKPRNENGELSIYDFFAVSLSSHPELLMTA
jgi:hypothetical protein